MENNAEYELSRLKIVDQFQKRIFETDSSRQQTQNADLPLAHLIHKLVDLSLIRELDVDRRNRLGGRFEVFKCTSLECCFDLFQWSAQINFRVDLLVLVGHFLPDRVDRTAVLQLAKVKDRHRVTDQLDFLKQVTVEKNGDAQFSQAMNDLPHFGSSAWVESVSRFIQHQ